jgi:imidazole glycerol-phosphate synthase subunit HisF
VLKTRLIPTLLLQDGLLVRSESFKTHQFIGDPIHEVIRFNEWNIDELIYLDISRGESYGLGRNDIKVKQVSSLLDLLLMIAKTCFVPLTFGGGIRTIDDIRLRLMHGADKVALNTAAFDTPALITAGSERFGSQCLVVCIDVRKQQSGGYEVFVDGGRRATGVDVISWAREVERRGAGEILLQSIDRDGLGMGFDCDLIAEVVEAVSIPVIALGGAGQYSDFPDVISKTGVSAVAAANIFHFKEMTDRFIKREMKQAGISVRGV